MKPTISRPADSYSPLYFLASLGAGGLAVTFFMWLMFWVPHPGQPVPVFADIAQAFAQGGTAMQGAIVAAMTGIAVFALLNIKSLVWNILRYREWSHTEAYSRLRSSNAETQLLAMPLALAMTVNVGFILGLVFVPGLWGVVEYLFPLALVAFAVIGWLAFRLIADFLGRTLAEGGVFDVTANNSFAQLMPAFALSMVAVGFAAPAAMSTTPVVVGISLVGSTLLGVAAIIYALIAAITAFNSMLHYGTAREAGPTLMIIIPIVTVLGIMSLRQTHGLHTAFSVDGDPAETLVFLSRLMALQLVFLGLGMVVLLRQDYFRSFVFGTETSPGAYALVCPGVALAVMTQFWLNKGLVDAGLVDKFSAGYWTFTAVALALQAAMIGLVFYLNHRHFGTRTASSEVPAE